MPQAHPTPLPYRADLDGLRAAAVVLVLLFHAFPTLLPGGYLGVDVFFGISGYLITSLVSREQQRGAFRLRSFYARRARRLLPALLLVTAACLAFGWFALLPEEYTQLGRHAMAASLFVPNFALWSEAGYWDTSSALKPLLHLWSLGVEEQFYLVWPALLMLFARRGVRRTGLPAWGGALALGSFALACRAATTSPEAAFYLPWFRMWELLLGGLLAHAMGETGVRRAPTLTPGQASAMSLAGLALILAAALAGSTLASSASTTSGAAHLAPSTAAASSATSIDAASTLKPLPNPTTDPAALSASPSAPPTVGDGGHHAPWPALAAVLGTLLVLAAGSASPINRSLLGNRAMTALGQASYPLYLWHWPLLSFVAIVEGPDTPASAKLALLGASLVLALATWRFVERPVRASRAPRTVTTLVLLYLATGAFGALVYARSGFPARTASLAAQLDAFEWESKGLYERDDCSQRTGVPTRCLSNGKPATIAVVGDSYSTNVFFTLQELHRSDQEGVMRLGKAGCLPLYDVERFLGPVSQNCRGAMNASLDYVVKDPGIRTVVLTLRPSLYLTAAGGNRLVADLAAAPAPPAQVFRAALDQTVGRLEQAGKDVVFVLDWPELDFDPKTCVDARPLRFTRYRQRACIMDRDEVDAMLPFYRPLVAEVLAPHPRAKAWDPRRALCNERSCTAMLDGVMMYRDDHHLSLQGSELLARHYAPERPGGN